MVLKEHELLQNDEPFIRRLLEKNPDTLAELNIHLINDLKEALERLNQNPSNSSKPSGRLAPWDKGSSDDETSTFDEQAALDSEINMEQSLYITTNQAIEDTNNDCCFQSESSQKQRKLGRQSGSQGLDRTQQLAIYEAFEGPCHETVSISADHQKRLENLRDVCEEISALSHQKTRELGREFLNDWETIFRVLDYPVWPLTNNEKEHVYVTGSFCGKSLKEHPPSKEVVHWPCLSVCL